MSVFSKPQCLVYTDPFSGKLTLQQDVLDELSSVTKQMNVVSITGLYRTGKSYLLNQLAGKIRGKPSICVLFIDILICNCITCMYV